jgi:hypothetical protein
MTKDFQLPEVTQMQRTRHVILTGPRLLLGGNVLLAYSMSKEIFSFKLMSLSKHRTEKGDVAKNLLMNLAHLTFSQQML